MCCVWNSIGLGQPGCKSTALSPETPARATRACSEIVPGRLSVAGTPPDMSDGLLAFRTSPVLRGGASAHEGWGNSNLQHSDKFSLATNRKIQYAFIFKHYIRIRGSIQMKKLAITLLFFVFGQAPIVSWAQTEDDSEPVDAESVEASDPESRDRIVVTAQRREEALSAVPLAVTAVSGEALSRMGATDTSAIGQLAPNVNFANETSRDAVIITIRGISATDTRNEADPTTAFHIDGGYVPRLSGANAYFFDLERVEILRGPQGTLYGRNSTSGAVNLISRKPENELGGFIETRYGNFDQFLTTGAINVPLVDDALAMRMAFISESRGGFRDNSPVREQGDDADDFAGRLHILGRPTERLTILGTYETYHKSGVGGVQAFLPFEGNPNPSVVAPSRTRFPLDTRGFRDNSTDAARLNVDYDLDFATATYQISYRDEEREALNDLDGTAVSDSILQETFSSESITHELRLTSNGDRNLDWVAGAFYLY